MPRFFVPPFDGEMVQVGGEDGRHIVKSLRCRIGEELWLCDGQGTDFRCTITELSGEMAVLRVMERLPCRSELPVRVTLYQALPKSDKLELIIQKAVELGAAAIVPVLTSRCVSRPDSRSMEKKLERLSRISLEAAKQSGRGVVPPVRPLLTLDQALEEMSRDQRSVLFYEQATEPFGQVLADHPRSLSMLIGAEGGFDPQEVEAARQAGLAVCTMGPRILRCETAPMYALSAVGFFYENQ